MQRSWQNCARTDLQNTNTLMALASPMSGYCSMLCKTFAIFGERCLHCVWSCSVVAYFYEEQHCRFVHRQIVERVIESYCELWNCNSLCKFEHPIMKLQLGVIGINPQLLMNIIMVENGEDWSPTSCNTRIENSMYGEKVRLLASQVAQWHCSISDIANKLEHCNLNSHIILQRMNWNISCLVVTLACWKVGSQN